MTRIGNIIAILIFVKLKIPASEYFYQIMCKTYSHLSYNLTTKKAKFHQLKRNSFVLFCCRKKETQGEADGAEEGGDQDRAGAEQTHLRVHLRVPADRCAELRVHRVPVGGRVRARAPHP